MISLVGGTYYEWCSEPEIGRLGGSGVRAARILDGQLDCFVTVADVDSREELGLLLDSGSARITSRAARIGFQYDTPLSTPRLLRDDSDWAIPMEQTSDDHVIVFGMIEAQPNVVASQAVVDPQHSLSLADIKRGVESDQLVIVANKAEIQQLAGESSISNAASSLLEQLNATCVILKAGALGALLYERGQEVVGIPAYMTPGVMPIGSGDVYTAAFASEYFAGKSLMEAAIAASKRTATYAATAQTASFPFNADWKATPIPSPLSVEAPPCVYVAASFAAPEQRWIIDTVAAGIDDIGGKSIHPLRDIGPKRNAEDTARDDIAALHGCDAVLLLADSARTGPLFEAGWAISRAQPVVVMSSDRDPDRFTMLRGTGAQIRSDLSTTAYHAVWKALGHKYASDAGDRLMLLSGGLDSASVAAAERPERALFVDYGQAAAKSERRAASTVAQHLGIELDVISIDASHVGSGPLVGKDQLPLAPTPEWFPFRNQLLVTVAAAHAAKRNLSTVIVGTVAGDGQRHADGSREFLTALDALLQCQECNIRLAAPHADTRTSALLSQAEFPSRVIESTHSCDVADEACGDCNSCRRRAEILEEFIRTTSQGTLRRDE